MLVNTILPFTSQIVKFKVKYENPLDGDYLFLENHVNKLVLSEDYTHNYLSCKPF